MIIFGPSYSLSWSTVLLTKVHKTDTKEKQREIRGGKKKETKCLAERQIQTSRTGLAVLLPHTGYSSLDRACREAEGSDRNSR